MLSRVHQPTRPPRPIPTGLVMVVGVLAGLAGSQARVDEAGISDARIGDVRPDPAGERGSANPGRSVAATAGDLTLAQSPDRGGFLSAVARLGGGFVRADGRASISAPRATPRATAVQTARTKRPFHAFYFTRGIFPLYRGLNVNSRNFGNRGRCGNHRWCTDWPEADEHLSGVIAEALDVDVYYGENAMDLDDPELRRYPFLYMVEPGYMTLTDSQREGLRSFLLQGGFLVFDDFWGSAQYSNFEWEMSMLLPEYPIVELPMDHPLFSTVYDIDEIIQVPNLPNYLRGGMSEEDGYVPWVHAIFDEKGRLLVVANAHTDIGDGMEHADDPRYPLEYSTYAFFMVMNMIVYALAN